MSDADTKNIVKITEAEYLGGVLTAEPHVPGSKPSPVHHRVWVGNADEGWIEVPRVTGVVLDLRQGELRKAVITVLLPQVEFEGGRIT